jgi:hypothetical protein
MQASPQNIAETNAGRERRERPRHAPSAISYVSVDDANGGVIVDISELGMAISSAEPITAGAKHILRFQLPRIDRMFETPASLVWTSDTKRNAGVRFDSLTVEDRLQIRNWLKDELFSEAFPTRAAARRKLMFSYDTLGDTTPRATQAAPASKPALNVAAAGPILGAVGTSGREVTPRVPKKELTDLPAPVTTDRSSEFDKLFPSERTLGVELQPRPGKFARLAESTSNGNIDTTALWMNFPSEAELAARSAAAVDEPATAVSEHEAGGSPAVEAVAEQVIGKTSVAGEAVEAEVTEEVVSSSAQDEGVEAASAEAAELVAPSDAEPVATFENSAVGMANEVVALPNVEVSAPRDLSVPMAAATAELEEVERVEESVANSEAAVPLVEQHFAANAEAPAVVARDAAESAAAEVAATPVYVVAQPMVEFEIAPPQEPIASSEMYGSPVEEVLEETSVAAEEAAPVEDELHLATLEATPAEVETASPAEEPIAETAPAEILAENQNETAASADPVVAREAAHIEVPAELLAPPLVFASAAPIAEEIHDEPVHELNPEPQGPEVAANRLDLLDISQAVRAPGKFSSANPVSDASLESLLAIAEEEDNEARRSQALKVEPVRKREPLAPLANQPFTQLASESAKAQPSATAKAEVVASVAPIAEEGAKTKIASPDPAAIASPSAPKPIRKVTQPPAVAAQARAVPPIASANALPHVALRSASQQTIQHDALLGDGDKQYRGLVIIAIFVLLAGCFAVGYSRHLGIDWPWSSTSTARSENPPAPKTQPPTASAPAVTDPSSAAPAIRNPTTITSPDKKAGTTPLPDASNVQPDANFEASALPTAQPAPPSFFPVTAPSEGEAPRMVALPEETVFDSPRVAIRLRQDFFVPSQPGPEWKHNLQHIQVGQATSKTPPPPASQGDAGVVHVRATVGADGIVKNVRPIDGPVALIPRSTDAIRKWRYQPSLLEGQPLQWQGDFSIEFRPAR